MSDLLNVCGRKSCMIDQHHSPAFLVPEAPEEEADKTHYNTAY